MDHESTARPALFRRIVRFPLTRIVIALVFVGLATAGAQVSARFLVARLMPRSPLSPLIAAAVLIASVWLAYLVYVRAVERRRVGELALSGAGREIGTGILVGCGLFAAVVGGLWAAGFYRVEGIRSAAILIAPLGMALTSGFVEEIFVRGILFRIMEEGLGTWLALALSALLFGFLHLGNANATVTSSVAIALEAGILLAAAFMVTRRLWLPIGIHAAWNFTQGGIFGVAVSGNASPGLLRSTLAGPELLSGGRFGAEASLFAVLICLAAGIWLLVIALRRGHTVRPAWRLG